MFQKMKIALLPSALVAVTALVSVGAAASPTSPEPDYVADVSAETTLGPEDGRRGVSPAGCAGQTDYAHKSGNSASVHGRTKCSTFVGRVGVTTTIQKKDWSAWRSVLVDVSYRSNSKTSQDAHPHWNCSGQGAKTYRGVSTHYSVEGSGTYYANTVGGARGFTC